MAENRRWWSGTNTFRLHALQRLIQYIPWLACQVAGAQTNTRQKNAKQDSTMRTPQVQPAKKQSCSDNCIAGQKQTNCVQGTEVHLNSGLVRVFVTLVLLVKNHRQVIRYTTLVYAMRSNI